MPRPLCFSTENKCAKTVEFVVFPFTFIDCAVIEAAFAEAIMLEAGFRTGRQLGCNSRGG